MKFLLFLLLSWVSVSTASAQTLSLAQLIEVRTLSDVSSIDNYLLAKGWRYDKSLAEEETDQVVWVHKISGDSGGNDATLNVLFCNTCKNSFCDKCEVHASGAQHAVTIIYQSPKDAFVALKRNAEALKMSVTTRIYPRALRTVYRGDNYELDLNASSASDEGFSQYFSTLTRKSKE